MKGVEGKEEGEERERQRGERWEISPSLMV